MNYTRSYIIKCSHMLLLLLCWCDDDDVDYNKYYNNNVLILCVWWKKKKNYNKIRYCEILYKKISSIIFFLSCIKNKKNKSQISCKLLSSERYYIYFIYFTRMYKNSKYEFIYLTYTHVIYVKWYVKCI